jgi:hypothetical protein
MNPTYIQMWANHRRKSFFNNQVCKSTSRRKTFSNMPILALNIVDPMALTAEETLVDAGIPVASGPILYRNQLDIL